MHAMMNILITVLYPEIILAAYHYTLTQTSKYLKNPLESTGLRPHISLAVDKSTPHRDTNHAILVLLPVDGKRIAVPLDAPPVYSMLKEQRTLKGGGGWPGSCRTCFKGGQREIGL